MDKFKAATYIVSRFPGEITPMKLQKLLYYSYVWSTVIGQKLFSAKFKAWKYGPVDTDVYHKYKHYNNSVIPGYGNDDNEFSLPLFDFILDSYHVFSAFELSNTTHLETPWKKYSPKSALISDSSIVNFYSNQVFIKNFPLGSSSVYYPPKTSAHYSFSFDMDDDFVPEYESLGHFILSIHDTKETAMKYFHPVMQDA